MSDLDTKKIDRSPVSDLLGTEAQFSKTIGESDVYGFAGITGDSHPNHTDEVYATEHGLGGRVAQGALLVGLIAGASTRYLTGAGRPAVSYGYDRVRFIKPVHLGDTISVNFRIVRCDDEKKRAWAEATLTNQRRETIAVGTNVIQFQ